MVDYALKLENSINEISLNFIIILEHVLKDR